MVYIGLTALFSKATKVSLTPSEDVNPQTPKKALSLGFFTNALNPKATIFFLAVFSVVVNPETPVLVQLGYGVWMVFASIAWFSLVTYFFSGQKVRSVFERMGHWFERAMGVLLVGLGAKLALSEIGD